MSDWSQPVPQRIGDAERDQAAEFLREHHAQGRIDAAEFDDRVTAALSATWQSDLDRLFVDLPSPSPQSLQLAKPATPPAVASARPASPRRQPSNAFGIVAAMIWPIAILAMIASRGQAWFLIIVAIAITATWRRRGRW